ncbi:hypothetical protein LIER_39589 [Lithospermum erythrorhizon]|uniref:Uncharacterized protein n=1 Tax=Lithospermum erythrorhizon TaxID=34254 RepID=A0AAV3QH31_LITER
MDDICYSSTLHEYQEYEHSIEDSDFNFCNDEEVHNDRKQACMIRWKSGKRVDPRLLATLESFREFYVEKRELFKKIFPEMYNEFVDVFKKLGDMMEKNKEAASMEQSRTLDRSLSFGSPRASSRGIEIDDDFVNEKFKVKPPTVIIGGGSDGRGAQTGQGNGK